MKKRNDKHEKRVKKLIIGCGICGIILSASTYAWFIGMKTVDVSSFDVKVAAVDSLELSLDGINFSETVNINSTNFATVNTVNNTNSWSELHPISSVGVINRDTSRLTMYEKGSFTQVPGGYRVMASEVPNSGEKESGGYVAFDLFIKNLSGEEYYSENNELNEEAIYLTPDSAVTVSDTGAKAANTGIENSVRVAFAQIGRVKATNDSDTAAQELRTGITCADDTTKGITGICRTAQIWEPNDTKHVTNAINWYNTNCKKRKAGTDGTANDVTVSDSYDTAVACGTVADGTRYKTYAISGVIDYKDNVNVYDGADYNTSTDTIATTPTIGKLMSYDYFTDSAHKDVKGVDRPQLISLAPNSITKVRVYIWIEGQDVDNYDFASLGKQISVAFGFSKEQLYGEDFDYNKDSEGNDLTDDEKGPDLGENQSRN